MTLWSRYKNVIAQGCLTNSKHPRSHVYGVYPQVFKRGDGLYLNDDAENRYTDYICGLGVNLTGAVHAFPGYSPSFNTELEIEAGESIKQLFPFVERLKFLKTGTEACAAAIKIARAYTGRQRILSEGYHGWSDDFVALTDPALGVPKPRPWINSLRDFDLIRDAAAVIVEPVITDASDDRRVWLQQLRGECSRAGTLLIFDEIITGLRFRNYSVARNWGITPDIICLGKALGGGYPLALVGGRADIMDNPGYFVSSTFAGEYSALRGWLATYSFLLKNKIETLWEQGRDFIDQFNDLPISVKIQGYPSRGIFSGDALQQALLFQEACKAGILFGPSWFFNFRLHEKTSDTINICADISQRILRNEIKLEGNMPQSPFSQKVRITNGN